jgi:Flp pilus assembly protein TadB
VLLSRAKTIGEVVQVESELSRREADLESLEAQLKKLDDLTSLATIDVHLTAPQPAAVVKPPKDDSELGFLSGLRGGWDAFVAIVLVALTVLGALVPFVLAAGLVGVPLLLVWRSRRRTPTAPPSAPADA